LEPILPEPVGQVISSVTESRQMPPGGVPAKIEIFPRYEPALLRLEENSHIWIQSWFHHANRNKLTVDHKEYFEIPEYGVFALRAPSRPNPIALSLARLLKRDENLLYLDRLDAIDGTPVLDIKPYFENDIIFSPRTSYIRGKDRAYRQNQMLRRALAHHQEECRFLQLAVRMALVAEEVFGHLNTSDLFVTVYGSACLADTIQGLSRARLANPARFSYIPSDERQQTIWQRPGKGTLTLIWAGNQEIMESEDEELLSISFDN
jgi:tRNA-Thr(GGU) m(6)t(6)A37 methyltransferase TsaA